MSTCSTVLLYFRYVCVSGYCHQEGVSRTLTWCTGINSSDGVRCREGVDHMRSCCGVSLWSLLMRTAARGFHPAAPHRNMIVFPQVSSRHAWGTSSVEGEDEGHWICRLFL